METWYMWNNLTPPHRDIEYKNLKKAVQKISTIASINLLS